MYALSIKPPNVDTDWLMAHVNLDEILSDHIHLKAVHYGFPTSYITYQDMQWIRFDIGINPGCCVTHHIGTSTGIKMRIIPSYPA